MDNKHLTYYNSTEEKLNVLTHGIGLVLSVVALVLLILQTQSIEVTPLSLLFFEFIL